MENKIYSEKIMQSNDGRGVRPWGKDQMCTGQKPGYQKGKDLWM